MVVIVIIGLASAAVVMLLPDPRGRVGDEADRFAARALAVRDDAIVQSRDMRVVVDATGYHVDRRATGRWIAANDRVFAPVVWAPGTRVALPSGGNVRATFDTTGGVGEPIVLALSRQGSSARVDITTDGVIRVGR